ncbi:aspartate-semialdehyde dehydrogenase [Myxococcus llanfairpwllgwyngyllgogerychwyrndrobwllllantysiliogogogochensis]|uniref:Aspartate-semialdehyde dehydrogenase n=1 Tax=Myxococcus llanfairpwllgwyngyllgogerychwyrndrobwllllantysiliogogogochensis TaxID=2590453 RepID=A0A540WWN4_9BACT|nr:aspartate-semialdehyde dehydrogenase [Myxococcus llanfairpwllgwyngyllgogerychwyrndrobwllllantysiliogogogochensis]TQF13417.1 aspartate-semialdehyde dehydrogenase [Myxococcus llanfairpwllgwyngyllgogerychwyrndrobwllllantysiliogogogochensis]
MNENLKIAVVGATGVVGREVLAALYARDVPAEQVRAFGSERSKGLEVEYGEDSLEVERAVPEAFKGMGLVLLATPAEASRTLAPAAQAAGAWVVDVSSAFRSDGNVPLVLPGFNTELLGATMKGRLVCLPSAVTTASVHVMEPLRRAFGVVRAQVTAMMSVSSAGVRGVAELEKQTADLMSGREPDPSAFPHRVGFNLVPQVGGFMVGSPWTEEEGGWTLEAARLFATWGDAPVLAGTAVQVPSFYGHGLTLNVQLKKAGPVEQVRAALKTSPALKVLDTPGERIYPMPMLVTSDPTVHVGRVRAFPQAPEWVTLFAAVDNATRGAALNLVEAGLKLAERPV